MICSLIFTFTTRLTDTEFELRRIQGLFIGLEKTAVIIITIPKMYADKRTILVRLYYRLFVRPRPVAKTVLKWDIDLSGMKAIYRGQVHTQGHNPFAGITMIFYMAASHEGGKTLCGGLGTIPAETQITLDSMNTHHQKQFLRHLIEESDRIFRTAWKQSTTSTSK